MAENKIVTSSNNETEQILEQNDFLLSKDDTSYKIEVYKTSDKVIIKNSNYKVKLSTNEISEITKIIFNSINEAYKYIVKIFNKKKVIIKDILKNNKIKLIFYIYDNINDNEKEIEIDLIFNEENKDYIIIDLVNKYNKLEKEVISLRNEIELVKDEIKMLKLYHKDCVNENIKIDNTIDKSENVYEDEESKNKENNNLNMDKNNKLDDNKNNVLKNNDINDNKFNENIKNETEKDTLENTKTIEIDLLNDITTNSYCSNIEDNTFCIFNSFKYNKLYLIYSTKEKSIISYNFDEKKIIKEIKNPHEGEYITNYRHCINNNKDIIMSLSLTNNLLRLWDFSNWECLLTIGKIYTKGYLYSCCFLNKDLNNEERNNYIITGSIGNNEPIKIFDFNGSLIKNFDKKTSSEDVYFIESYFDKNLKKFYIITGNNNYIKSYNFYETNLYKKYCYSFDNNSGSHCSCAINENINNNIVKLIDLCYGSDEIYIWNFHTGELFNKIITNGIGSISCCLWDENYFFVGCRDRTIKLFKISKKEPIQSFKGHKNWVSCIKKIKTIEYGECLISQGDLNDQIKLWAYKKDIK